MEFILGADGPISFAVKELRTALNFNGIFQTFHAGQRIVERRQPIRVKRSRVGYQCRELGELFQKQVLGVKNLAFADIATQEVEATLEAWVPLIAKTFASELLVP